MKYSLLILLFSFILLQACNTDSLPQGYIRDDSGIVFNHHIKGEGDRPTIGYKVFYHLNFRQQDSLIGSSWTQKNPLELVISDIGNRNFLRGALLKMATGDSLSMIRLKDSMYNVLPKKFLPEEVVYIDLKMMSMQKPAEVKAEKAKLLEGYSPSKKGRLMKKVVDTGGKKAKVGNGTAYHLKVKRNNTEVYNTSSKGHNRMQIPYNIDEVTTKNPLMEALSYMAEGDELSMAIEYDSLPKIFSPDWGFQSGDLGLFDISLIKIFTAEEMKAERARIKAQKPGGQNLAAKDLKKHAEVQTATLEVIEDYKAKKLEGLKITSTGLEHLIITKGDGPAAGEKTAISVNYSGFLLDGTEFDSSFKRTKPISFTIGEGHVIKGWDIGMDLLNEGGKAYFFIPPYLAYGELGRPGSSIPGNATLVFYVEMVEVKL